jgi:hypothetical protein
MEKHCGRNGFGAHVHRKGERVAKMDLGALQELPERREGVRIQEGDEIPIAEVVGVTEDPHQDKHDHMENQELPEQTRGRECLPLRRQAPVRFEVCQTQFSRAALVLGSSASSQKQRRSLERGRFSEEPYTSPRHRAARAI